jgi:hypothetical protein
LMPLLPLMLLLIRQRHYAITPLRHYADTLTLHFHYWLRHYITPHY